MDKTLLNSLEESDIEKLRYLFSLLPQQQQAIILRIFCDEYSCHIKENRSKAYYSSVQIALKHLAKFFGKQKVIQSIGLKDIEQFTTYMQKKAPKGYRVYFRTLKAAFNKAKDWGYVNENYFLKVKLPKKQKINPAFIDSKQLEKICLKIDSETVRDITILAFCTGMRLSELVNLRWNNVSMVDKIITVGDEEFTTKGRNQRYIPISDEAFVVLSRLSDEKKVVENKRKYVFCKAGGFPYTGDFISKKFKAACKEASIENSIHFHSLRHSFASNLAQRGVSLYIIKELLGHSSISTTEIYSHLNINSLKEAIKVFDAQVSTENEQSII
ncbi:MAG: tyrosine-type recombinase/integrase [Melioribacteraceae bacterium]|nr:tyrosine-type recombinase/integrase [Melioribacteraceae bacterium]